MDLSELAPAYVRAIAPYQPGKPIAELAREMGLPESDIVKLASNENPLGASPRALAAIENVIMEHRALSGWQRLYAEDRAGGTVWCRSLSRSCWATAPTTCWNWLRVPF